MIRNISLIEKKGKKKKEKNINTKLKYYSVNLIK